MTLVERSLAAIKLNLFRRRPRGAIPIYLASSLAAINLTSLEAQTETVLHNFLGNARRGASPYAGVIRDSAGNLYGTASAGGAASSGVVFKLDILGLETILHSFTGGADGGVPYGGVVSDSAGNLYGSTYVGGAGGAGVVYELDTTGVETVLYNFTGGADGGHPWAGVTRDSTGNLYGTTYGGGVKNANCPSGCGVVYKLAAGGEETVLYAFIGEADGGQPYAGVTLDSAGNLYGTTYGGGTRTAYCPSGCGIVYKLNASGQKTAVHTFTGGYDGANPYAGVIFDSAGNLYGTTYYGEACGGIPGADGPGCGVVYELPADGGEGVVYAFEDYYDGGFPIGGVILDSAGNLYGTTQQAGSTTGGGEVYEITPAHGITAATELTLLAFGLGAFPAAGVIRDSAGNLYGTTVGPGSGGVYKLDKAGDESVYSFPASSDGILPAAGVVRDLAGNLYGTTSQGGTANSRAGTVYKLDQAGKEVLLYGFTGGVDGGLPSGVIRDSAGDLYGTTFNGGTANVGVVFEVDTTGHETVLYNFTGGPDGGNPVAGLIRDASGNLYGTTGGGGGANAGVVFEVDTTGHETVLYSFTGGTDGGSPSAGVIRDSVGNLYGTTYDGGTANAGVVFKVDAAGHETVLYNFTGGSDGSHPVAGVVRDLAGNLYGTTNFGGGAGFGVVFKLSTTGKETVLHSFAGAPDGSFPGSVIRDSAGNLYGTTAGGGAGGFGMVFKLNIIDEEMVLYSFTGGVDGNGPNGGLIVDSDGNLYGTTYNGGTENSGVVFKIAPQ